MKGIYIILALLMCINYLSASEQQCVPPGNYEVHHLAKPYGIGKELFELEFKNGFEISKHNKKNYLLYKDKKFNLTPIKGDNKDIILTIASYFFKNTSLADNTVCGYSIEIEDSQDNEFMIIKMDMKKISPLSIYEQDIIKRSFPVDFASEDANPKYWTIDELKEFQYFLVWYFSIPSVTAGIIFIPMEKTNKKSL